jgi:hypothetical protein
MSEQEKKLDGPNFAQGGGASDRSHAWLIGYFAKISSARLNALSIAACDAIPFFITSNSATLKTCSASTWAIAGL